MDFKDLKALSQMRYEREQQTLKKLVVRENSVRADLDRLNQHEVRAQSVPFAEAAAPRALGADILWMKWLSKSRGALNMDLARILAQKEQHLAQVRHAYGKVLVSETLSARDQKQNRKRLQQQHLNTATDQSVKS